MKNIAAEEGLAMKYYVVQCVYRQGEDGSRTLCEESSVWVDDPTGKKIQRAEEAFYASVLDEIYLQRLCGIPFHEIFGEDFSYSQNWYRAPEDELPVMGFHLTEAGVKQKSRRVNKALYPELSSKKVFADFLGEVKVRSSQGLVLEGLYRTRDERYLLHQLPLGCYRDGDQIDWPKAEPARQISFWEAVDWAKKHLMPDAFKEAFGQYASGM